ncbi:MAG: Wzz/FepE/Etk N-terminal domain-containing protein [Candidatus Gastranaerophilaceae bacterium]|jgi:uncharacterized protein involved in exopolysaccharide biosynthesis
MKNFEDNEEEITINLKKIFKILQYRILNIIGVFLICVCFFVIAYFITPKQYISNADLYINKGNTTNLADINPFMVADLGSSNGGMSNLLKGGTASLDNEIEIINSPLVLTNVIKENNIKYKKGKKKGEFISVDDFLKTDLSIGNKKGTSVIEISYKSEDPKLSYNIVNSIISNYKKVNEEINVKKSVNDKKLLENSYETTNKTLNSKLAVLKNKSVLPAENLSSIGMLGALRAYNRVANNAVGTMISQSVEGQKSQVEVAQEVEKLKMIKEKLEWSSLVEKMSKNASNVIVLKKPVLKRNFEKSEPKFTNNIILGILVGFLASIIAVIATEINDKKLTYSTLGEDISYNEDDLNGLKLIVASKSNKNFALINFTSQNIQFEDFNNVNVSNLSQKEDLIKNIKNADSIILAGEIKQTSKKSYNQIKTLCKELDKKIIREVLV